MSEVAFLLGNLTDGGSETKTVKLANRLSNKGTKVHLIYLGAPHTLRSAIGDKVAVEFLDRRGKFSFRALRRLKAYVISNDIESIFCVNLYPLIYGWPVCRLAAGSRHCIAAMNTYEFSTLRDRFFMLIYGFILRRCELVIFGSHAQQELWTRKYRLRQEANIVIYNGVDAEHFRNSVATFEVSRASLGIGEDAIVIGCVAHLRPEKSHIDLLAAMELITNKPGRRVELLLVGDGPEEQQLRSYTATHGLSGCVKFCGGVRDVRPYLEMTDIFVMPSSTEVFSNAILEAMSAGLPIVCTAVGGSVEMVVNGETGITYPRQDVNSLVDALQTLMIDNDKRGQFGRRGAKRAREVFSIARMDDQYAKIISSLSKQTNLD